LTSFFGKKGFAVVGDGHGVDIGGLTHLGARGEVGIDLWGDVKERHQHRRVFLHQHEQVLDVGQACGDAQRHDGAVFGDVGSGDGDVFAFGGRAGTDDLGDIGHGLGVKRRFVEGVRELREPGTSEQAGDGHAALQRLSTSRHEILL